MSDEPIDAMAPWTIKAAPTALRAEIVREAQREGVTVGQLLERVWAAYKRDGSPVAVESRMIPVRPAQTFASAADVVHAAIALASLPENVRADSLVKRAASKVRAALGEMPSAPRPGRSDGTVRIAGPG